MRLTGITFTGADETVDPVELLNLSRRYPFIEWGILFSKTRQGLVHRYPSFDWVKKVDYLPIKRSAHICGYWAAEVVKGNPEIINTIETSHHDTRYGRVQLNGFSNLTSLEFDMINQYNSYLRVSNLFPQIEFILQTQKLSDCTNLATAITDNKLPRTSILYDISGGLGIFNPGPYPHSGTVKIGQAGGIDITNIIHVIEQMMAIESPQEYWIDMESSLRDFYDEFSIEKCKQIAATVEKFIHS